MQIFQFFVTDARYSVRTLKFVETRDALAARSLAERMLDDPNHIAVEVWDAKRQLFSLEAPDPHLS